MIRTIRKRAVVALTVLGFDPNIINWTDEKYPRLSIASQAGHERIAVRIEGDGPLTVDETWWLGHALQEAVKHARSE
jgi:hypothetical protein